MPNKQPTDSVPSSALRIAMLGHKFIPSRNGGVEVVVSNLAPHLAELGYDVTCFNRTGKELRKQKKDGKLMQEYRGVHLVWTPTIDRHTRWTPRTGSNDFFSHRYSDGSVPLL